MVMGTVPLLCRQVLMRQAVTSNPLGEQSPELYEVVGRRMEGADPINERTTAMMELAQQADGLHPSEGFSTSFHLCWLISAGMPGGAPIDR